jgi:cation diffusion facilitator CzcD-associated flavoprotein CzcO
MRVGVLGSGDVAKTLGAGFMKHGHQVTMGTRHPEKLQDWSTKGTGAQVASFSEAAKFGELVVVADQGAVAADALRAAGAANLDSKTVIDVTNPIAGGPVHSRCCDKSVSAHYLLDPAVGHEPYQRVRDVDSVRDPLIHKCQPDSGCIERQRQLTFGIVPHRPHEP